MSAPATQPGALMAAEIAEQPAMFAGVLREQAAHLAEIGAAIRASAPRFVLFAARGTSDHAALYAKYLVETKLGLPAGLASPSTMTLYKARPAFSDVLFVGVSQSGGSPDLLGSLRTARECGALTLAVTNDPTSPLASAAELSADIGAGPERAVAATKSYTAQLLALYLIVGSWAGLDVSAAQRLPEAAAATLANADRAEAAAARYRFADRLVTAARGYSYPTAREGALKLMETSYLSAQAFSGADLLHGPMAMLDSGVPVIAVRTPGAGGAAMDPVLRRLAEAGADVLLVGPQDGLPVDTAEVGEELAPLLEILPLQQLACRLASDRGGDPDAPRGLRKVTETY